VALSCGIAFRVGSDVHRAHVLSGANSELKMNHRGPIPVLGVLSFV
jgi:hypothetical protein